MGSKGLQSGCGEHESGSCSQFVGDVLCGPSIEKGDARSAEMGASICRELPRFVDIAASGCLAMQNTALL